MISKFIWWKCEWTVSGCAGVGKRDNLPHVNKGEHGIFIADDAEMTKSETFVLCLRRGMVCQSLGRTAVIERTLR